jgi:sortase A
VSVATLVTRRVLVAPGVFVALALVCLALLFLPRSGAAGAAGDVARWSREGREGADAAGGQAFAGTASDGSPRGAAPVPAVSAVPEDHTLRLTVPDLARVDGVPVETGGPTDERALREGALHIRGTGFPWQRGANTYIAGHRLGFPGTGSNLLFWDLGELDKGDRVLLRDANGRVYEYAVFREMVVGPEEVRVTAPVPGKSVVSLQTCTLPDYAERLVVQAELVRSGA